MPNLKVVLATLVTMAVHSLACIPAHAALTISSTRIVQTSDKQSTSVVVANPSRATYAAQAWINTEADDITTAVPLIASPALFQIAPQGEQTVQINRLPNDLANDRETLFFFNLQEIPQAESEQKNSLTIALRTRIKLFYRPSEIQENPADSLNTLQWSVRSIDGTPYLIVDNPSPFYFTFGKLVLNDNHRQEQVDTKAMAVPKGSQTYKLKRLPTGPDVTLAFDIINDYGGRSAEIRSPLSITAP
ncbi:MULTISPECIES: molecular chaperone [Pseudomonas]|uniref:Molecular chaperone n=1 Tax=Pseudomonas juntendi TaxID=2666183 RepID=A0A7W2Q8A1_9PSED|nr:MULTISPECIES: molecular chaperone [Pseudomonas]MBA6097003.1 molecular chaperone [Pseudomonas juntendi]